MNRRSFLRGAASATLAVLAPLKYVAPASYEWVAGKLTFADIVTATLQKHSAEIAERVTAHNAILSHLVRHRGKSWVTSPPASGGGYEISGVVLDDLESITEPLCYSEQPIQLQQYSTDGTEPPPRKASQ